MGDWGEKILNMLSAYHRKSLQRGPLFTAKVYPLKLLFVLLYCTAPHLTITHDFSSIRVGGSAGCIDPIGPQAELRRRSPHYQAEPGFELATFCL